MVVASERVDRTPQCDLLNMLMVDENHDTVSVPLKGSMLYLKEDQVVWVTSLDVNELIRGACINVSVIQVFIRYLVQLQATLQEHKAYLILVPYNEDNHWILMAIDLSAGVLYQFDPLAQQQPRQLSCDNDNDFNLAYKSYKSRVKGGDSKIAFDVVHVKCAQQTGGLECGYYIMKFMDELVKKSCECSGDVKQIQEYITSRSTSPYSQKELDEIREEWARFFREDLLL